MSKNKYQRQDQTPPPTPGVTPDSTPAAKDEIATDISEVARERLSGSDKTQTASTVAKDAAEAAPGVAGNSADDDTAAAVEAAPTAVLGKDNPGPKARGEQGPDTPTPTPPAGPAGTPPPMTSTGGSQAAPAAPTGATAGPSPDAPPASTGSGVARAADPDTTASSPTAPDAAPTSAAAAAEAAEAEKKPGAPATPTRPAPAAGNGAAPAAGARPAPAAGARPAPAGAGGRPGAAGGRPGAAPAAPPRPPEPDPDEVKALRELVPDLTWERRHGYVEVKVPSAQLIPIARAVRGLGYDYLSAVTAVDWRDRVEMLYHCYGWDYVTTPGCVVIRSDLPPEPNPLCPSLTAVWAGAELQEREVYDLFGVKFVGHPDLRRILLEDRFPGHPLRKDWTFDYEYVLVKHLKYGAEGQDAPPGGEEGFRRV